MCTVLDAPTLDSEDGYGVHDLGCAPKDDVYDAERSSLEGEPAPRVSLRLGEPRPGHLQTDVCPAGVGISGWRRVVGRDVAFGEEDDPSGLEAIPPHRGTPFYEIGLQGDGDADPGEEAALADLEHLMTAVPA